MKTYVTLNAVSIIVLHHFRNFPHEMIEWKTEQNTMPFHNLSDDNTKHTHTIKHLANSTNSCVIQVLQRTDILARRKSLGNARGRVARGRLRHAICALTQRLHARGARLHWANSSSSSDNGMPSTPRHRWGAEGGGGWWAVELLANLTITPAGASRATGDRWTVWCLRLNENRTEFDVRK